MKVGMMWQGDAIAGAKYYKRKYGEDPKFAVVRPEHVLAAQETVEGDGFSLEVVADSGAPFALVVICTNLSVWKPVKKT